MIPKKSAHIFITAKSQKIPATEPKSCSEYPVITGKIKPAKNIFIQRKVVVIETAFARSLVGNISDIISHGIGPRAKE